MLQSSDGKHCSSSVVVSLPRLTGVFYLVTVEQLCQILVLSDQLLIVRLKQICEFHIANLGNIAAEQEQHMVIFH